MQITSLKLPHINSEISIHVTRDWLIYFLFCVYNIFVKYGGTSEKEEKRHFHTEH
jgi:hypothetical protein